MSEPADKHRRPTIGWFRFGQSRAHIRRPLDAWSIGAGLVVLVLCMFIVRNGEVSAAEKSVFRLVNGLPDALRAPMWIFQIFGSLAFVAVASVVILASRRWRLGLALAAAIPLKLAFEWWVVKALVERERPVFTVPSAVIRDVNTSPIGFPSGHAIFAFAVAGLLAPYLGRRGTVAVYLMAVANSVARVYLGAHNPLDVVAGAAVGLVIAACINLATGVPEPRSGG
ncbi:MAG: phosphatase PAP2 family protein [bacterium]|nr:phosphatase PAP2 family protein [bacterium]